MTGLYYQSSDLNKTTNKNKLSSIISGDNFIYGISSKENNKLLSFKELPYFENNFFLDESKLKEIFSNNHLLENIEEIKIAILSPDFVFCPSELYTKESEHDLLKTVTIKQYLNDYSIETKFISHLNSYLLFLIPKVLKDFLKNNYDKVNFFHANEIFLSKYKFINSYENLLIANINNGYLQTAIYKNDQFRQTNVYNINNKEDILYHIISNLSNHSMPVNIADVILAGRLERESAIFKILAEHIKNISFIDNLDRRDFSNVFLGKSKHLFFDIYALSQCES
ncbi:MAG TPA: DUF3822 family protein [Bacteroidetes bacterium]|nr:DUF3822 family protein [Bacteroidota bacterium]